MPDICYVDAFDLDYERRYLAVDDVLQASVLGQRHVTLGGFSAADIVVLEVSDPLRPTLLTDHLVEPEEGNTFFIGQISQLLGDPATPFVRP